MTGRPLRGRLGFPPRQAAANKAAPRRRTPGRLRRGRSIRSRPSRGAQRRPGLRELARALRGAARRAASASPAVLHVGAVFWGTCFRQTPTHGPGHIWSASAERNGDGAFSPPAGRSGLRHGRLRRLRQSGVAGLRPLPPHSTSAWTPASARPRFGAASRGRFRHPPRQAAANKAAPRRRTPGRLRRGRSIRSRSPRRGSPRRIRLHSFRCARRASSPSLRPCRRSTMR